MTDEIIDDTEPRTARGRRDTRAWLIGLALVAAALAVMLAIGPLLAGDAHGWDHVVIAALHGAGPRWLRVAMIDVTALGGGTILTIVVAATAGLLLIRRLWLTALLTIAASLTGGWTVDAIKALIGRARPDVTDPIVVASGYSFPSGHAANSAIVYLTIAALLSQVTRARDTRRYLLVAAVLLVGAIGTSRVYLGVHWPSDVVAGWSFGTLWALGWWSIGARARSGLIRQRD